MEALAAPKVKAPKYLSIYNKESRKSAETSCQLGFPLGVGFVLEKLGSEFVALSFEVSGEGNLGGGGESTRRSNSGLLPEDRDR